MRRRAFQFGGLALAGTMLSGCWLFSGGEWKKKITVTVATPAGDVSGSVVRWEKMTEDPVLSSSHSEERGEAVIVEISNGRYLFALIEAGKPDSALLYFPGEAPLESTGKLNRRIGESITVPPSMYPRFVTFDDINDPKTVKLVDPENLAATFGAGYALKGMVLEITDEPVTEGVVERLIPWINDLKGSISKDDDLPYGHILREMHDGLFRLQVRR
jgi:hypothetical protein